MYLALINSQTNIVENIIVPPTDGTSWVGPEGFYTVLTNAGSIGDTYTNQEFVKTSQE